MTGSGAPLPRRWPVVAVDETASRVLGMIEAGPARGVLLRGGAGVGKTALAEVVARRAEAGGAGLIRLTATAASAHVPFGAFGVHLRHLGEVADRSGLRAEIERVVSDRQGTGTVVLVIDDVPLLDPGSADVLAALVRDGIIRLVATARDGQAMVPEIDGLLVSGLLATHLVRPLGRADIEAAASAFLGAPLTPDAAALLYRSCEGVPLYARELVQASLDADVLVPGPDGWDFRGTPAAPTTLFALVASRFAALGETHRQAFEALALAQPLPVDAAEQLASLDMLATLEAGGLVTVSDEGDGAVVRLAHPLYDDVVRAQLGPLQRRRAAVRAVEAIEGLAAVTDDVGLRAACLRVEHGLPISSDRALHAARQALRLMDPVLGERLVRAGDGGFDAMLVLGAALTAQGRIDDADVVLERAVAAARDDRERARAIGRRGTNLGNGAARFAEAIEVLEAGLATIDDERWRSFVAADLAYARLWSGQVRPSDDRPDGRAVPDAVRANECLIGAVVAVMGGQLREAEKVAAEGLLLVPALVDDIPTARELLTLSSCLAHAFGGDADAASAIVTTEITRASALGTAAPGTWIAVRAMQRMYDGDALGAIADSWEAARHLAVVDIAGLLPMAQAVRSVALAQLGRIEESLAADAAVDMVWRDETKVRMQLAVAAAWRLAHQGAVSRAASALAAAGRDALDANHVPFAGLAAHDAVRLGVPRPAIPVLRALRDRWEGPLAEAVVDHAEALTVGDADALVDVGSRLGMLGLRLAGAEAAAQAAALYARTGRTTEARRAEFVAASQAEPVGGLRTIDSSTARGLTPREREIATLAAQRRRSKEIAELLGISTRTVDNHLASVYQKLGIANRDELATRLGSG